MAPLRAVIELCKTVQRDQRKDYRGRMRMSEDTRFVRDRLEITDLVHSYAHHVDRGDMDGWIGLFTDDVVVDIAGLKGGREVLEGFRKAAREAPPSTDQTRHLMSNLVFTAQSADLASGSTYLAFIRTTGGKPELGSTGCYTFSARRTADGWRLAEWVAVLDSKLF